MKLPLYKEKKRHTRKIVMIGVDGADWRLIHGWMKDGYLKHLNEMTNKGAKATLRSTIPPFTLPAWTSIFTGVNPGKHGITDNLLRIGGTIKPGVSSYRKTPLLWKLLSAFGLKSIVLNDPVTYPPEPINGVMVSGFLTPPNSEDYVFPPEIKDEVDKASGGYMPELPLNYDKLIAQDRKQAYNYIQRFAQKTAKLALHMIKNYEWNIFNVTFTSTDRLQHFYWHDKHLLREHYVWLDSIIGDLVTQASNEEAYVIILSDHGFAPLHRCIHVNTLLAEEGIMQTGKSKLRPSLNRVRWNPENLASFLRRLKIDGLISRLLPEHVKQRVSPKDSKFLFGRPIAKLYSAAGIFIEQSLCNNYEALRNLILRRLLSLRDEKKKVFANIYRREEVLWGAYTSRAPDLLVIPSEGYYLSTTITKEIFGDPIQPSSGVRRTGNHRMEGIFLAQGPNIREGYKFYSKINTWDIAPTILNLFGLTVPEYMDGTVLKWMFKNGSSFDTEKTEVNEPQSPI